MPSMTIFGEKSFNSGLYELRNVVKLVGLRPVGFLLCKNYIEIMKTAQYAYKIIDTFLIIFE